MIRMFSLEEQLYVFPKWCGRKPILITAKPKLRHRSFDMILLIGLKNKSLKPVFGTTSKCCTDAVIRFHTEKNGERFYKSQEKKWCWGESNLQHGKLPGDYPSFSHDAEWFDGENE